MEKFISTTELAILLGISRISVFRKIKQGEIRAQKIGRNYVIEKKEVSRLTGERLGAKERNVIERGFKRVIKEYSKTLKKLGEE